MGKETDIWDDSALINAFNDAISKYKMHNKGYQDNSAEGEKERNTAENVSDRIDQSHDDTRQIEVHDDGNAVSNTGPEAGIANDLPQSQESYHANSHGQEAFMQTSHIPHTQKVLDGFSYSQDVGEYNKLLSQYYELEEQRQKVLQQLHEAGYWNYQGIGEGSGSSAQWGACSTFQEQHQVPIHQSSLPGVVSSCCPYVCPCLVAPCSSLPCCASSGSCVSNIGTDVNTASCMMGPQKSSSFEDDIVVKTGLGAAERAISSFKMTKSSASNIHEEREKDVKSGSSLSEDKMVQCMNSDTDLGVVLHAWYSAGFYTGKYLVEQSMKGKQG
ncbi:uncharacterized protein LOC122646708 isoform X2 [Telopea speciosissima]|uniref:uncharacterized protein LOC122646708 isoform X2 n=1 Tax=Telopea speciosissima TaxID=54955 RepID=UPI001CC35869|nr:uncharacterized protein LOC122646708 isoform X2 [Telopea speciosissima]